MPSAAGQDEPAPLESPPGADSQPVAPWHRLPYELKERIIDSIELQIKEAFRYAPDDADEPVAVGFFAKIAARERDMHSANIYMRDALVRLRDVDRQLRSVCAARLWQRVHLYETGENALERFLQVLPAHASHVRSFHLGHSPVEQRTLGVDGARGLLAARAVRMCSAVEHVELRQPEQQPTEQLDLPSLRIVTLGMHTYTPSAFEFLPGHQLTSLSITTLDARGSTRDFGVALGSLPCLRHLRLSGAGVIDDDLLLGALPFAALHAFISNFSSTLVSLALDLPTPGLAESAVPAGLFFNLPRLSSLALSTNFASPFFLSFASPSIPLSFLRLDFNLALYGHPGDAIALIAAHRTTLKRVHLSEKALGGNDAWGDDFAGQWPEDEDVDAIVQGCEDIGVRITLRRRDLRSDEDGWSESSEEGESSAEERQPSVDFDLLHAFISAFAGTLVSLNLGAHDEDDYLSDDKAKGLDRAARDAFEARCVSLHVEVRCPDFVDAVLAAEEQDDGTATNAHDAGEGKHE